MWAEIDVIINFRGRVLHDVVLPVECSLKSFVYIHRVKATDDMIPFFEELLLEMGVEPFLF